MIDPRLARQSLARSLTDKEMALALSLEEIFATGAHDFAAVATALQEKGVARPSGAPDAWTEAALTDELAQINASLDAAYAADGIGA